MIPKHYCVQCGNEFVTQRKRGVTNKSFFVVKRQKNSLTCSPKCSKKYCAMVIRENNRKNGKKYNKKWREKVRREKK